MLFAICVNIPIDLNVFFICVRLFEGAPRPV